MEDLDPGAKEALGTLDIAAIEFASAPIFDLP